MAPQHAEKVFVHGHSNPFLSICFPFILQNTMCFDANLLTWRSMLLYAERRSLTSDEVMITHRATALRGLQESLASPHDTANDAAALTVACLMCVEMFCGDFQAVRHHAQAVHDIRSRRGSPTSAIAQFVTGRLEHAEGLAHKYLRRDLPEELPEFVEKSTPAHLKYPRSPLAPSFTSHASNLPSGFLDLVMSESVSYVTIDCIQRLSQIRDPADVGHEYGLSELRALRRIWEDIDSTYSAPSKPQIEHWLYFGLHAYCAQLDDELCHPSNQAMWTKLIVGPFNELTDTSSPYQQCLIWIHVCLAGAVALYDSSEAGQIVDLLLNRFPESHNWEYTQQSINRFFCTKSMVLRWKICWESRLQRFRGA